jgi:hypothetical protein
VALGLQVALILNAICYALGEVIAFKAQFQVIGANA